MIDIRSGSVLNVACNSGIQKVRVIEIKKHNLSIGAKIVASAITKKSFSKINTGIIVHCILIRTKYNHNRKGHLHYSFHDNAVVLTTNKWELIGSIINGPCPYELVQQYPHMRKAISNII